MSRIVSAEKNFLLKEFRLFHAYDWNENFSNTNSSCVISTVIPTIQIDFITVEMAEFISEFFTLTQHQSCKVIIKSSNLIHLYHYILPNRCIANFYYILPLVLANVFENFLSHFCNHYSVMVMSLLLICTIVILCLDVILIDSISHSVFCKQYSKSFLVFF